MILTKLLLFRWLLIGSVILSLFSCSDDSKIKLEHSFKVALKVKEASSDLEQVKFKPFENLNLGFYEGNLWIKLSVRNGDKSRSYMIVNDDLINRNYRFYKEQVPGNRLKIASLIDDDSRQDARTFNFSNPNFKIDLKSNEVATFYIVTRSDGRMINATPRIMEMAEFTRFMNTNKTWSIIFLVLIILLLVVNIFLWNLLKRSIYFYYIMYMLATFLMYFGFDGNLYSFGLKHIVIDHLIFISVRIWVFSLMMYTSNFLETKIVAPKYFKFIKVFLFLVLGGTTLYQFIWFETSVSNLHFFENILSFAWLFLILLMMLFSAKKRRLELKYYLIPLLSFLMFTAIGLIDGHLQFLPGDPFFYIKTGTIIEFIGFTYFIARLIKIKIKTTENLESELILNRQELIIASEKNIANDKLKIAKNRINKTDLVSVFKLLEHSISSESDWADFKLKFEELNPSFLKGLVEEHSDLSKSEIRLITMVKIGYSQKEIANILNIEPNSVKKAKSRVRKKMNIPSSIILNDYLLKY